MKCYHATLPITVSLRLSVSDLWPLRLILIGMIIDELIESVGILKKPKIIDVTKETRTAETLVESCVFCTQQDKVSCTFISNHSLCRMSDSAVLKATFCDKNIFIITLKYMDKLFIVSMYYHLIACCLFVINVLLLLLLLLLLFIYFHYYLCIIHRLGAYVSIVKCFKCRNIPVYSWPSKLAIIVCSMGSIISCYIYASKQECCSGPTGHLVTCATITVDCWCSPIVRLLSFLKPTAITMTHM